MEVAASPPLSVTKRIFRLYWAALSAGSLSLIVALVYASPERQSAWGTYAWYVPLAIFLFCSAWVVASEAKFHWQRRAYRVKVSVKAVFNLKIENEEGDIQIGVYREVTNSGKVPIKNLPPLGISADDTDLQLKVRTPKGKSTNLLAEYTHPDGRFNMHVWVYQVPEGLEPGESIAYTYETMVRKSEANAFTEKGGVIVISQPFEYDEISCRVTAPAGYKFELVGGVTVRDELNNLNRDEIKQVQKRYPPRIPRDTLETTLEWRIAKPLFRHEYECRYRLVTS